MEVPEPPRETGSDRPRFIRFDAHHDLRAGGGHESQLARLTAVPVDDSRLPRTNSRDPQPRSRRQDICVGVRLVGSPAGSPPAPCTTRTRRRGCRTRCGSAGHSANPYRHCHTTCASGPATGSPGCVSTPCSSSPCCVDISCRWSRRRPVHCGRPRPPARRADHRDALTRLDSVAQSRALIAARLRMEFVSVPLGKVP